MKEEWKQLDNHPNYLISSFGRIKNIANNKIYNGSINNHGYVRFDLCENGKRFVIPAHRAVANAFLPKINGKNVVNHIDGCKTNNHVTNLEWCTHKENVIHAKNILKVNFGHNRKKVMCVETGIVFSSCCEAERIMNISNSLICCCANNKRPATKGYHFKYV